MFGCSIFLALAIIGLAIYLFGRKERSGALGRNAPDRPVYPREAPPMPKFGENVDLQAPLPPPKKTTDDELFENIVKRLSE